MIVHMLTTVDNPHDPFTNWEEWYAFDVRSGYNSTSLLGRIAMVDSDESDADYDLSVEQAIDEIVKENASGMHRKVSKEYPD